MSIPSSVKAALSTLTPEMQKAFRQEYSSSSKSVLAAYLFWFLIGFHYLYMGRIGMQFALWASCLIGIGFIWWLIDFFRVPGIVRQHNHDKARELMAQFKAMA